jgi:serine/threonine protein kinase
MASDTHPSDVTSAYGPGAEAPDDAAPPPAEGLGTWIGPYKLVQHLGEGGMGAVYLAEQEHPVRRRVAVKVIKPGMASAQVIARFEAERQALALMDHPNIARVYDAGTIGSEPDALATGKPAAVAYASGSVGAVGRPYFVMELIRGAPITTYCDDHRLTTRERLGLFVPVCRAIQHAHQKGVIHRDVKPSNVLVTVADGAPVPKVIDFGLAKATEQQPAERPSVTQYGTVVGTLEYMSPEQAETSAEGVDTRTDIYSLGVLLYELLTGATPLGRQAARHPGFTDLLRMIRDVEPPRPSTHLSSSDTLPAIAAARRTEPAKLARLLKGDLDWVVMKCLEKDRARRYETAGALARDVERFLADEPVEACPPSAGYRLRRFARKYRAALAAAGTFVLLLLAGAVVSTWQALRATAAERREREAARQMQSERDRARLALTRQVAERLDGDLRRLAAAGQVLAATVAQRPDWRDGDLEGWLRTVLGQDPHIFGMSLAFEPRQFDPGRADFCLYVFRGPKGVEAKQLLPPSYVPIYREWDWYKKPFQEGRALWSEPYVDTGGGDIPMVTYSGPVRRRGQVAGVLTLDLSVEYFDLLRGWLKELNLGGHSYGFVISRAGTVISHPHPGYDFAHVAAAGRKPRTIAELAAADADFAALARRMQAGEAGAGTARDPSTGRPATFLFAPVPSAGWTFVAVIEEPAAP